MYISYLSCSPWMSSVALGLGTEHSMVDNAVDCFSYCFLHLPAGFLHSWVKISQIVCIVITFTSPLNWKQARHWRRKSWVGTQNVLSKSSTTVFSAIGCCYSRTQSVVVTIILEHKKYYIKYNFRLHWSLSSRNLLNVYFIIFEHVRQACQHFNFPAVSPNSPMRRSSFIPLGCHSIANVYKAEYVRSLVWIWRRDDTEERRRVVCFHWHFCTTLNILLCLHAFAKGAEFCCSRIFFCCTSNK
jgi:hypothetical protein